MKQQNRLFKVICLAFSAVLMLAIILFASGCEESSSSEDAGSIEIVDSGVSVENESMWIVIHNGTDKPYGNITFMYELLDADGENIDKEGSVMYMRYIPYIEAGATYYYADSSWVWVDGGWSVADLADISIELKKGSVVEESSLEDYTPFSQVMVKNVQIGERDGDCLFYTFEIVNDTDRDFEHYAIEILYKDNTGNYCGGDSFDIDGVKAHETRAVNTSAEPFNGAEIEVYARPLTQEEEDRQQ